MKLLCSFLLSLCFLSGIHAQDLFGEYMGIGYFYHPSTPRNFYVVKTLTQVSAHRYQVDIADIGNQGFAFQFDVDANNNLVNWSSVGNTPVLPASNFMTIDDPGNFYPGKFIPGTSTYLHTNYPNKFDPLTKTFYLHYGYATGAAGQNGFTRQVYERLDPKPLITSVSPLAGSATTPVTIRGKSFSGVKPGYGITFGGSYPDSAVVVSDSVINAWVGSGASGDVIVSQWYLSDTMPGFVYTPVSPVATDPWRYVGSEGFSAGNAYGVSAVVDTNNIPYVVFADAADGRARVMKYAGNSWVNVGSPVSAGKCGNIRIAMDTANNPVIVYTDSANNSYLTAKKFDQTNWVDLGFPLPAPFKSRFFSFAIDRHNTMYLPYILEADTIVYVSQYNGVSWNTNQYGEVGNTANRWDGATMSITVDKNNVPYLLFKDLGAFSNNRLSVKKLSGSSWIYAGAARFADVANSDYYPVIKVDNDGNPVVAFQENNGFERASVYKLENGIWNTVGSSLFSKGRSHFISMALDTAGKPAVVFIDRSFNNQGSAMIFNGSAAAWSRAGNRGFLPTTSLEPGALVTDKANNSLVAFSDITQNGRVSVMMLVKEFIWTGAVSSAWEDPANWNTGYVPSSTSNVTINAGGVVVLSSNTSISGITVNPGASFTIVPGNTLTILGH